MSRSSSAFAARSAIPRPAAERWKPGSRPYMMWSGFCTSPCRSRCTVVAVTSALLGGGRGGARGLGQGVRDPVQDGVVVSGRDEPRLVRGGRQVDAAVQHRVEEGGIAPGLLAAGAVVVADLVLGEEHREQAA